MEAKSKENFVLSHDAAINRRDFLGGLFASAGLGFLGGCRVFTAPAGWRASGRPNLVFGVLSDIHVRLWRSGAKLDYNYDTTMFRKALEYFRSRNVDAVVIAGDMADRGLVDELEYLAKDWFEVFPDGCGVEKIFVFGNHDLDGHTYDRGSLAKSAFPDEQVRAQHLLSTDMKRNWERIFHEKTDSVFMKTVKGYRFIGQHWDRHDACEAGDYGSLLKPFLDEHADELRNGRPFFYVQHPHLANTVFGPWAWGHDDGRATEALFAYPNAVAFSGHSHFSETDERAIWQGGFTSLCCSSLRYTGLVDCLRGDVKPDYENGFQGGEGAVMKRYESDDGQQGLLVNVYDGGIVYERRDFRSGEKLGPDWVQPFGERDVFAFEPRKARETAPEFPPDVRFFVEKTEAKKRGKGRQKMQKAVELTFTAANAAPTRPYGYRVTVEGDGSAPALVRYVLAEGYHLPPESERARNESFIVLAEAVLPAGKRRKVTIEPFSSFGNFGKPVSTVL